MIRFDSTTRSVVAICNACGRRELFNDRGEADGWARGHLEVAHPAPSAERTAALTASRMRHQRR